MFIRDVLGCPNYASIPPNMVSKTHLSRSTHANSSKRRLIFWSTMKLLFSLYIQHIRTLQRSVIREMSVLTHTHTVAGWMMQCDILFPLKMTHSWAPQWRSCVSVHLVRKKQLVQQNRLADVAFLLFLQTVQPPRKFCHYHAEGVMATPRANGESALVYAAYFIFLARGQCLIDPPTSPHSPPQACSR